jgi:hypothetical protein
MTETEIPDPPSTALVVVPPRWRPPVVVDVGIEVASTMTRGVVAVTRTGLRLAAPFARLVVRPPVVPQKHWPQSRFLALADHGRQIRERREDQLAAQLKVVVPAVVGAVVDWIDLTALVVNKVDFDRVIAAIDIEKVIDQVDINAIAGKLDVAAFIEHLDIDSIARNVIVNIDLPEIIRESSGAMASETVIGVRMRGIEADERIAGIVDRVMRRRRGRNSPLDDSGRPDGDV